MSTFGGGTRFPVRFGGGKSRERAVCEALIAAQGSSFSKDENALVNKENMCTAQGLTRARAQQERGANQAFAELATTSLAAWERIYSVTPAPSDNEADRRATLFAIESANLEPTFEVLENALTLALGEAVTVFASLSQRRELSGGVTTVGPFTSGPLAASASTSRLKAGQHAVRVVFFNNDGTTSTTGIREEILIDDGDMIEVPAVDKLGFEYAMLLFSTRANELSETQVLLPEYDGSATTITDYPSNPALPGLHHYQIAMSATALASQGRRLKAHRILGTALPAHCTYDLVDAATPPGTGFLLDITAPPGSPLGTGGL